MMKTVRPIMSKSSIEETFREVIVRAASHAKSHGFKRQGQTLRKIWGGNAAIIEFQRSRDNTSTSLRFTINIAIVCGLLIDQGYTPIEKTKSYNGHLIQRIGYVLPSKYDTWWEIDEMTRKDNIVSEILGVVLDYAVPFLEKHISNEAMIDLWSSGTSPGITDFQRQNLLDELIHKMRS